MKLYQYAVIHTPKRKNKDEGPAKPKVIVPITEALAENDQAATLIAARAIPEDYADKLSECEVAIRPF